MVIKLEMGLCIYSTEYGYEEHLPRGFHESYKGLWWQGVAEDGYISPEEVQGKVVSMAFPSGQGYQQ